MMRIRTRPTNCPFLFSWAGPAETASMLRAPSLAASAHAASRQGATVRFGPRAGLSGLPSVAKLSGCRGQSRAVDGIPQQVCRPWPLARKPLRAGGERL